jgi:hypothetical protein
MPNVHLSSRAALPLVALAGAWIATLGAAAAAPGPPPPAVVAGPSAAAVVPPHPTWRHGRYTLVDAGPFTSAGGAPARGRAACPRGTAPFGGGAVVASVSTTVQLTGSAPSGRRWTAAVANHGGAPVSFDVLAVCGPPPAGRIPGYAVAVGPAFVVPAGGQRGLAATCPDAAVPLGGGLLPGVAGAGVTLNASFPAGDGWHAYADNPGAHDVAAAAFVVCGDP